MSAPVEDWPDFILHTVGSPDDLFWLLGTDVPWEHRDGTPRHECFMSDHEAPYTYGSFRPQTFEPQPWHPAVLAVRSALEQRLDTTLDACFLNAYLSSRDSLGWHADDSPEMDPERPIVVVSLGAERPIQFRSRPEMDKAIMRVGVPETETMLLRHGSALVMPPGMQQEWFHRIPKVGYEVGPRLSLTFRGFLPQGLTPGA